MKKADTKLLLLGISVSGLALGALIPVAHAQPAPSSSDTVSAVGTPVPNAPDASSPSTNNEKFPPQPVSVAPTEDSPVVPPPATPAVTPAAAPAAPAQKGLTPVPQGAGGSVQGTNVMGDGGAREKNSGTYYDSNAIVPDKDLAAAGATGPRKVDPAYEPGQKFIVVEQGPKATSFEGQYVAATRALKLGRYAAAMEMFEKLYKKNNRDPRILMGLAVAQQGAGFSESAARTYEDLLRLQPNNADAIINLMGLMKNQYPSVTLKKLTELRDKYPTNPGIPAQIGLIDAQLKQYDEAIRAFQIAASMDPTNASHIYNMAIVTDKKGDASGAIKLYEQALQLDAMYGDIANALPRDQIYDRLVVLRRKV